ncbi:MAG TPA: hypothetical protein VF472_05390 [Burkholderiaceae bacterium]
MSEPAADWVPYRLEYRGQWLCRWFSRAGRRYAEPFFEETVTRCLGEPPNGDAYPSLSSLDFLEHAAGLIDPVPPTAFIFHVSRCGSTLLAQLLGLDPRHIVLSEAPLIDALLRLPMKDALPGHGRMVQAAISLLGNRRFGEQRLFVKLDSWHVRYAGLLRELYPDTPFILLTRAPQDVLRSQRAQRGTHAVPGLLEPELFGMQQGEVVGDADAWLGRVLTYYYARFAELAVDRRNLLLDYRLGAEDMMSRLARHLGMEIDASMLENIRERCRFHSKRPGSAFCEVPQQGTLPGCLEAAEAQYRRLGF